MMWMMLQTMEEQARERRAALDHLLQQVAAGDRQALATVYETTRTAVYALALSLLRRAEEAQDATQDTYVRLWESAHTYRPHTSPMAWLLTITRNLCRMKLRQESRLVDLTDPEWDAIPAVGPAPDALDRYVLETALATLAPQERQVVLLHAVSGLKHREIASLLGRPLATILSQYHRAMKKLRTQLEGDDIG